MTGELWRGEGLPSPGGTYAFDEETMRSLIKDWYELAESYRESQNNARLMAQIDPPGEDPASVSHAAAANRSGASYLKYLQDNEAFCHEQMDLFQKVLNDYLAMEDAAIANLKAAGSESPHHGN